MNNRQIVSILTGVALSSAAFYFALRNVPLGELVAYFSRIQLSYVFASFGVLSISWSLRIIRWRLILSPYQSIGFWNAFHPVMIGFMANCILPARAGEIIRPAIHKAQDGIPISSGLAFLSVERLLDLMALLFFLFIAMRYVEVGAAANVGWGNIHLTEEVLQQVAMGSVYLCLLIIFIIILFSNHKSLSLVKACCLYLPRLFLFLPRRYRSRLDHFVRGFVINLIDNVSSGFLVFKAPIPLMLSILSSGLIWITTAGSYYLLALGSPGIGISFFQTTAMMVVICFFIALPSVPGYWGLWEAAGVFALSIFSVPDVEAVGYTLANHALQILPLIIGGIFSSWMTGFSLKKMRTVDTVSPYS